MDIIFAPLSPEKTAKMFRNAAFFQGFSIQMYQHYTSFTDYAGCYKNVNILTLCIDPKHIHGNAPTLATKVTKYPIANFQPQFLRLAKLRGKKRSLNFSCPGMGSSLDVLSCQFRLL